MKNLRRHDGRLKLRGDTLRGHIYQQSGGKLVDFTAVDISNFGVGIRTTIPFQTGDQVAIAVMSPLSYSMNGQVKWVTPTDDNQFLMGIQLDIEAPLLDSPGPLSRSLMRHQWTILSLVVLFRCLLGYELQIVNAIAPSLTQSLGLSFNQIGILFGVYSTAGVFLPFLSDRIGQNGNEKRSLLMGLSFLIFGNLMLTFSDSFTEILISRISSGCGFALLIPITTKMVNEWFLGRKLILANGISTTILPIGGGLAFLLGPHISIALGWNASFGGLALAFLLLLIPLAKINTTSPLSLVSDQSKKGGAWSHLVADRSRFFSILSIWSLFSIATAIFGSYALIHMTQAGMSHLESGAWLSASTLTALIGGSVSFRLPSIKKYFSFYLSGVAILCGLSGAILIIPGLAPLSCLLIGFVSGAGASLIQSLVSRLDKSYRGFGLSILLSSKATLSLLLLPFIAHLMGFFETTTLPILVSSVLYILILPSTLGLKGHQDKTQNPTEDDSTHLNDTSRKSA